MVTMKKQGYFLGYDTNGVWLVFINVSQKCIASIITAEE
jgi:hypothetical protein